MLVYTVRGWQRAYPFIPITWRVKLSGAALTKSMLQLYVTVAARVAAGKRLKSKGKVFNESMLSRVQQLWIND